MSEIRFSVVVPVYRNRDSLGELVRQLRGLRHAADGQLEVVFVVDGSPDDSSSVLRSQLEEGSLPAQLIELSRNFGSFAAIRVGIAAARGEFIAVMSADLQEPPALVDEFFLRLESRRCDVVVGRRSSRDDPASSQFSSRAFWWLYRRLVNRDLPPGGVDVFGCSRQVADKITELDEIHSSLVGMVYWLGFRREEVPYARAPRHSGESAWSLRKKVRYLFDSVYAFTDLPIVVLQILGLAGMAVSALLATFVFLAWLGGMISEPGYAPLMIAILASTSSLLLGLGVLGSYVWRAYQNGMNRPYAVVSRVDTYPR